MKISHSASIATCPALKQPKNNPHVVLEENQVNCLHCMRRAIRILETRGLDAQKDLEWWKAKYRQEKATRKIRKFIMTGKYTMPKVTHHRFGLCHMAYKNQKALMGTRDTVTCLCCIRRAIRLHRTNRFPGDAGEFAWWTNKYQEAKSQRPKRWFKRAIIRNGILAAKKVKFDGKEIRGEVIQDVVNLLTNQEPHNGK